MVTLESGQRLHAVVDSPIGPLTLVAGAGRLAGLYMDVVGHEPPAEALGTRVAGDSDEVIAETARQLRAYFSGEFTSFDLPLALAGSPFQRTVWAQLRQIPYGQTISYGELARRIGQPAASRAVGLANGRNPVSIVVPCHRVIGANGRLTGYGGGLDRKQYLLALEQRVSGQTLT
ncbi:MAG TPA: methylated-DNA--[protein]-cysteine S-methyltransferase [Streptosporangiaceae bacterium]|nr:methylated-DNA--[protein]-cysteine S-methyltransferase [Streptosporangiaceae bacterium]